MLRYFVHNNGNLHWFISRVVPNSGIGVVNTANINLNGTGATVKIFTAGASGTYAGCAIRSILIKAQNTTLPGMIRLYLQAFAGGPLILFNEIIIPSFVRNTTTSSFSYQVIGQGVFCIPPGYAIYASTDKANSFNIIVDGSDWKNV